MEYLSKNMLEYIFKFLPHIDLKQLCTVSKKINIRVKNYIATIPKLTDIDTLIYEGAIYSLPRRVIYYDINNVYRSQNYTLINEFNIYYGISVHEIADNLVTFGCGANVIRKFVAQYETKYISDSIMSYITAVLYPDDVLHIPLYIIQINVIYGLISHDRIDLMEFVCKIIDGRRTDNDIILACINFNAVKCLKYMLSKNLVIPEFHHPNILYRAIISSNTEIYFTVKNFKYFHISATMSHARAAAYINNMEIFKDICKPDTYIDYNYLLYHVQTIEMVDHILSICKFNKSQLVKASEINQNHTIRTYLLEIVQKKY